MSFPTLMTRLTPAKFLATTTWVASLVLAAVLGFTALAQDESEEALDPELVTQGEEIFQETAGGVGCAYCHGEDGRGAGEAGTNAPNIQGAQESALRASLSGGIPLMSFIDLSEDELQAVLEYLAYLAENPPQESDDDQAEPDNASEASDDTDSDAP